MATIGMCLGVISLQACQHYIPDFDGTYVANSADIQADRKTVNDILSAFKQAEAALQRQDIDGIMELYSDSYKSQSFDKPTLRRVWAELFQENHDFSTTHVFTQVKVEAQTAQIVCTVSLWAISDKTNARINLDSWFGEVHYMVLENGNGVFAVMPGKSPAKSYRRSADLRIPSSEPRCERRSLLQKLLSKAVS